MCSGFIRQCRTVVTTRWGLVPLLHGRRVMLIPADQATIGTPNGGTQTNRRDRHRPHADAVPGLGAAAVIDARRHSPDGHLWATSGSQLDAAFLS
jgi:hypothetical protein